MDWRAFISVDPRIAHGRACIRGTRVPVAVILANLAAGRSIEGIIEDYPSATPEAILATLAYAAELADERTLALPA